MINRCTIRMLLALLAIFVALLAAASPALAQSGSDYDLTWSEEAALLSGDIQWIEAHFGKLDAAQRTWLECRLQQEKW